MHSDEEARPRPDLHKQHCVRVLNFRGLELEEFRNRFQGQHTSYLSNQTLTSKFRIGFGSSFRSFPQICIYPQTGVAQASEWMLSALGLNNSAKFTFSVREVYCAL